MNDEMRASAALAASIKLKHPGLDLPVRENLARAKYQEWKEAWDARGMVDQLPDHAAPAAELEPEQVGEPAPHLLPVGWTPRIEALYTAMMTASPDDRREAFRQAVARWPGGFEERDDADDDADADEAGHAVRNTCRW